MPSNPIRVTIKGDKELLAVVAALKKDFPKKIAASLYKSAEKTMTRSKRDFVPVDTGALRSSGIVEKPKITKKSISVTLAYGGAAIPYAVIQHEDMSLSHTVGQAKYLEQPLKEDSEKYASTIAKDLKL